MQPTFSKAYWMNIALTLTGLAISHHQALAADASNGSYYVERRSYGTLRDTEPPRYVKSLDKTWLHNTETFNEVDWLDIGLDYRFRYEMRDNDFRRSRQVIDDPILLRTRAYIAVKNILDPLRMTLELEDSRRNHSEFPRDNRDVNLIEPVNAYAELYFDEALQDDDKGNHRPVSVKAGRMAFEYLDRRLLSRNEWRNTTNTFQGLRATIGEQKNDWQLDLLALQPLIRTEQKLDQRDESQRFFGIIGDWRRWSNIVTLQPYYLRLMQDGDKVEFAQSGLPAAANTKIDRDIHTAGLRAYGIVGKTGFDYDVNLIKQWGDQDRLIAGQQVDGHHDAYAYVTELGYSFADTLKSRVSVNYGFASGDKDPNDLSNQRFERLFGFSRPWSNNDYIQMENIAATKLHWEFQPFANVKMDTGYSWYRLDSDTDAWNAGANLRNTTGRSGRDVGQEFDIKGIWTINDKVKADIGYAYFMAGDFTEKLSQARDAGRDDDSHFFYVQLSLSAF
jgi:hypothetical protein